MSRDPAASPPAFARDVAAWHAAERIAAPLTFADLAAKARRKLDFPPGLMAFVGVRAAPRLAASLPEFVPDEGPDAERQWRFWRLPLTLSGCRLEVTADLDPDAVGFVVGVMLELTRPAVAAGFLALGVEFALTP